MFGPMRLAAQHLRRSSRVTSKSSTLIWHGQRFTTSKVNFFSSNSRILSDSVQKANVICAQPLIVKADPTSIVAGIAIVGALFGMGKMIWSASSSSAGEAKPFVCKDISQSEMALFFTELTAATKDLFNQLPEIESAMRKYLKDNNQELNDAEFHQAKLSQLYQMMESIEHQIVASRQWSRQCIQNALEKYAQDAEILKLQEDLNSLMLSYDKSQDDTDCSGVFFTSVFPAPVEIPDELTADKTLDILKEIVASMEKAMVDMLAHARAEGITDVEKAMKEFQSLYMEHVEHMTQAQMKACGISQQIFTAALQKYHAEDELFRLKVQKIYAQQAKAYVHALDKFIVKDHCANIQFNG
ncbi:hypothetical protein CCR75_006856 [Bremia lactucae]|uniref:Uncharacterized protein n=1 Tax=Bremia lactucae TaxID=4779 RepID=A0A976IB55_BRELC|nr:hypothetical protein CCR75_006856 [Bremia lactucae]